ncbi:hypothetical protein [Pseudooceanicola sp.]|uniref:hypothetical protein n=1 Tax=Pseudooceanicola sp. TaxID=1914328 RepID=UPI00344194E1
MARLAAGEVVDPSDCSMRRTAWLATGAPDWAWANRTLFVGPEARLAQGGVAFRHRGHRIVRRPAIWAIASPGSV